MSKEATAAPVQKCRPRFKGIENFLRRVAYNLGNSPSQTEVKIISCIPIDVSDMQNKIISLERELETKRVCPASMPMEARMAMVEPRRPPSPGAPPAAPAHSTCGAPPTNSPSCCREHQQSAHPSSSCKSKKSCVSFMYPSLTSQPSCKIPEHECANRASLPCSSECEDEDCERSRGLLRSLKRITNGNKKKEKDKCKTHYVYYAETMNSASPFTNYTNPVKYAGKNLQQRDVDLGRSYLASMVRKQYRAETFAKEPSDTSEFSTPICRDASQSCAASRPADSDACSCCHGTFHNIDHAPRQQPRDDFAVSPMTENECVKSMYYDSSLYDLVPVREKPPKAKIDEEIPKKRELRTQEFRSCLEKSRDRSRYQPQVVNYQNMIRVNRKSGYKRKLPNKSPNRIAPKRKYFDQQADIESSNSCSVDCGGVYLKPSHNIHRAPKTPEPVKTVLLKNAECLTISVNTTECQTASSKSVQLETSSSLEDNKTEITLNQIKSILQSVLTEVKTSSQVKTIAEDKPRKDAIVQKSPSQSNIQACSSLLNSFSYSPYNMSPYMPSCSRQVNNPLCYPNSPFSPTKCLQNYPLFIQTGRQCACCFRNIPSAAKSAHAKQTTTVAATNTEAVASQHRNKETDKLIKEIYKSIAVNMDYPAKDTSTSEYDDLKSSKINSQKVFQFKYIPNKDKRKDVSSSETNRNKDGRDNRTSSTTQVANAHFGSDVVSNTASTGSRLVTRTAAEQLRNQRIASYLLKRGQMSTDSERREARGRGRARVPYVVELPNATTPSCSDTETPDSDDADSDDTVATVRQQPKKKSGLFSKVVRLFKPKSKKQKEVQKQSEKGDERSESEASDSDDYQTICTHPSRKRSKHVTYTRDRPRYKPRPHSKLSYSRYYMQHRERPQERSRRTPYMEQEYRRYWNENLAFHGGRRPKYSSERPFSRDSEPQSRRRPTYYRDYEARSAIVGKGPQEATSATAQLLKRKDLVVEDETVVVKSARALEWLRRYKQGLCGCGREWKRFLIDS